MRLLYTLFNSVDIVTVLNLVILVGIWWWSQKWKWKSLSRVRLFVTHGLYSPWNSPGQNTGVRSLSLLQGIFPTHESNHGLLHCRCPCNQRMKCGLVCGCQSSKARGESRPRACLSFSAGSKGGDHRRWALVRGAHPVGWISGFLHRI